MTDRYDRVAVGFSRRVDAVPTDAWDNAAPCEGWVARDVVGHLTEWVPGFLGHFAGISVADLPTTADDPVAAWHDLDAALSAVLTSPDAVRDVDGPMGPMTIEALIDQFVTTDILIHTWDLARATGLDEQLDQNEDFAGMLTAMEPIDETLRTSGHYGPRVDVAEDADAQTRLLAFLGRKP